MNCTSTGRVLATSCLINNYNYRRFVCDAIDGALAQSEPFDEIIVVDDGSTDGSAELIARRYANHDRVRIVTQRNEGQLSCFNKGFSCAHGQVVFFLDADDVYEPNYVAESLEIYRAQPEVDFVFCGRRLFGDIDDVRLQYRSNRDLGYSAALTALKHHWIGAPTSCLLMRRGLLEKILPAPFVESWRIRADDCLVFGASLAGARKFFLAQPLVRYRVHASNRHFGVRQNEFVEYRRRLAINALFEFFRRKFCYDPTRLGEFAHREFATINQPEYRCLKHYARLVMQSDASLFRRVFRVAGMTRQYLRGRFGKPPQGQGLTVVGWQSLDGDALPSKQDAAAHGDAVEHYARKAA